MSWTKICLNREVGRANKENDERIIEVDGELKNDETFGGGITKTKQENKKKTDLLKFKY